jgi:ABC-type nitrate/sulfonate/bicarbonate transport system permease component
VTVAIQAPVSAPAGARRASGRGRDAALGVLGLLTVVAVWELLPRIGIVDPSYLPPFSTVAAALVDQVGTSTFWTALSQTLRGWAIGLAISMVAGIAIGMALGSVRLLRELTASTIEFLRPIPSVALIPLVVLMYGSQPRSALVLVVYASFWQVLVQVMYGVADVDPIIRDTARSYRFSLVTRFRTVAWPTTLPYIVTGFRLAAAVALILEVTAELVIGVPGLGQRVGIAKSSAAVDTMYALILVIGLIGVAVNVFARAVERRVLRWHPSVRREQP